MTTKERQRQWYLKNRERILEDRKRYREDNAETIKARKRIWSKENYLKNPEKEKLRQRKWVLLNREKACDRTKRYYQKNKERAYEQRKKVTTKQRETDPQKFKSRRLFHSALRNGTLVKESCRFCGDPNSHGHHSDYNKPLEIVWMCRRHHNAWHRLFLAEEMNDSPTISD